MDVRKIKILVIENKDDFSFTSNNFIEYVFMPSDSISYKKINSYDGILLLCSLQKKDLLKLKKNVDKYKIFYCEKCTSTSDDKYNEYFKKFARDTSANYINSLNLYDFIPKIYSIFNWDHRGGNYDNKYYRFDDNPDVDVKVLGCNYIEFSGEFGDDFKRCAYSTVNFNRANSEELEFWPEFAIDGDIELEYRVSSISAHNIDRYFNYEIYKQSDLDKPFVYKNNCGAVADILISVYAKGKGTLKLGPYQARVPRHSYGTYMLGGKSHVDNNRGEIITYFDAGDGKGPLNVYFAGFHTAKGFEGYNMMKEFGSPFLLISDMRQTGGEFYLGSKDTENIIINSIKEAMDALNFESSDLILSGISMGTTAALYYAKYFNPRAVIIGKPLINIATIAKNLSIYRSDEFDVSLDMCLDIVENKKLNNIDDIDDVVVDNIKSMDNYPLRIYAAYMLDDDYDNLAMDRLHSALEGKSNVSVFEKGFTGKHNDDTFSVVAWFRYYFKKYLEDKYSRK